MEEHRSQGLCYNCDEKIHPGHQKLCKYIFSLQVEPDSEDKEEPKVAATISLLALTGIRKTQMMQLATCWPWWTLGRPTTSWRSNWSRELGCPSHHARDYQWQSQTATM